MAGTITTRLSSLQIYEQQQLSEGMTFADRFLLPEREKYDVFISHNWRDSRTAKKAAECLAKHQQKDVYIDVLDRTEAKGEELGKYIREKVRISSRMMVVLSEATKSSWWVPYEVGVAQRDEKNGSVLKTNPWIRVPEYLESWERDPRDTLCPGCRHNYG